MTQEDDGLSALRRLLRVEPLGGPADHPDLMAEGLALLRAFVRIRDPEARAEIMALAKRYAALRHR